MAVSSEGRMWATLVLVFCFVIIFVSRLFWLIPITNVYRSEISANSRCEISEIEEALADEHHSKEIFRNTAEMEEALAEENRFRNTQDGFEDSIQVRETIGRD